LTTVADVLAQIRKAKSTAKVTMKTPVTSLRIGAATTVLGRLSLVQGDLVNAGVVEHLELVTGHEDFVEIVLGEPPAKKA
jgi:valyl-tRNA synthetase